MFSWHNYRWLGKIEDNLSVYLQSVQVFLLRFETICGHLFSKRVTKDCIGILIRQRISCCLVMAHFDFIGRT